jgi:hypothetical protein
MSAAYFVLTRRVFDYLGGDDCIFERGPLERLAQDGQLMAYCHDGFFYAMDTYREYQPAPRFVPTCTRRTWRAVSGRFWWPALGGPYNVGAERAVSIAELAAMVAGDGGAVEIAGTPVAGCLPERYVPSCERAHRTEPERADSDWKTPFAAPCCCASQKRKTL